MASGLHKFSNSSLMAALAGFGVAAQRGRSGRRLVRVVAAHAGERSAALRVAGRFAHSIGGADEFDPVFAFVLIHYRGPRLLTRAVLFALIQHRCARLLTRAVLYRAWRAVEMQNVI